MIVHSWPSICHLKWFQGNFEVVFWCLEREFGTFQNIYIHVWQFIQIHQYYIVALSTSEKAMGCVCQKGEKASILAESHLSKIWETAGCAPHTEGSIFKTINGNSLNFSGGLCNRRIVYCRPDREAFLWFVMKHSVISQHFLLCDTTNPMFLDMCD